MKTFGLKCALQRFTVINGDLTHAYLGSNIAHSTRKLINTVSLIMGLAVFIPHVALIREMLC
jgi:hypothetical protein